MKVVPGSRTTCEVCGTKVSGCQSILFHFSIGNELEEVVNNCGYTQALYPLLVRVTLHSVTDLRRSYICTSGFYVIVYERPFHFYVRTTHGLPFHRQQSFRPAHHEGGNYANPNNSEADLKKLNGNNNVVYSKSFPA